MAGFVENNNQLVLGKNSNENSSLVNFNSSMNNVKNKILEIQTLDVENGKLNMEKIHEINGKIDIENSELGFRYLRNYLPEINSFIDNNPKIKEFFNIFKGIDFKEGNIDVLERHINPAMFNKFKEVLNVAKNHLDVIASQNFNLIKKGGNKKLKKNGTKKIIKKSKKNRTINNKVERKIKYKGGSSLEELLKSDNNNKNFYTIIDTDDQPLFHKDFPILIYFNFKFDRSTENYKNIKHINDAIEALKKYTDDDMHECAKEFFDIDNKSDLKIQEKKKLIKDILLKYKNEKEKRIIDINNFIENVELSGEIYLFRYDSDKKEAKASSVRGPFNAKITYDFNNGIIKEFVSNEVNLNVLNIILTEGYVDGEVDLSGGTKEEDEARAKKKAYEDANAKDAEWSADQVRAKAEKEAFEEAEKKRKYKLCSVLKENYNYKCNKETFIENYRFDTVTGHQLSEDYNKKVKWVIKDKYNQFTNAQTTTGIYKIFEDTPYYNKTEVAIRNIVWYKIDRPETSIKLSDLADHVFEGLQSDAINLMDTVASIYTNSNSESIHAKLNEIIADVTAKHESNRKILEEMQQRIDTEIIQLKKMEEIEKKIVISQGCFISVLVLIFVVYIFRKEIWDMIIDAAGAYAGLAIAGQVVTSPGFLETIGKYVVKGAAVFYPGARVLDSAVSTAGEIAQQSKDAVAQQTQYFMSFLAIIATPTIGYLMYLGTEGYKQFLWGCYSLFVKPKTTILLANKKTISKIQDKNDRIETEYVAKNYVPSNLATQYIDVKDEDEDENEELGGGSGIYKKYTKTNKNAYKNKLNKTKKNKGGKNKMSGGNNEKIIKFYALELLKFSVNFVGFGLGIIDYQTKNSLYDNEYISNSIRNAFLDIRILMP